MKNLGRLRVAPGFKFLIASIFFLCIVFVLILTFFKKEPHIEYDLFRKYACYNCHKFKGLGTEIGPELDLIAAKCKEDWLRQYIKNPYRMRPVLTQEMTVVKVTDEDLDKMIMLLQESAKEEINRLKKAEPLNLTEENIKNGENLFLKYNCYLCHNIKNRKFIIDEYLTPQVVLLSDKDIEKIKKEAPDLGRVSSKIKLEWLYDWFLTKHSIYKGILKNLINDLYSIFCFLSYVEKQIEQGIHKIDVSIKAECEVFYSSMKDDFKEYQIWLKSKFLDPNNSTREWNGRIKIVCSGENYKTNEVFTITAQEWKQFVHSENWFHRIQENEQIIHSYQNSLYIPVLKGLKDVKEEKMLNITAEYESFGLITKKSFEVLVK